MRQPADFPHRGAANGVNLDTIHTLPFLCLSFWGAGAGRRESPEMPGPQLEGTLWPSSCGWCVWVSLGALQPCPTLLRVPAVSFWHLIVADRLTSASTLAPLCGTPENLLPMLRGAQGD